MSKGPIRTTVRRLGHVELPANEIDSSRAYTIEFEEGDRLHRWTDARPVQVGDIAVFEYANGANGVIVEMSASLRKIFARP